jgi:hypothetical protein
VVTILSSVNWIHIFFVYFFVIRLNINRPSTLTSSRWSLPLRLSDKNFRHFSSLIRATCMFFQSYVPCFVHHNNNSWRLQIAKVLTVQFS